MQLCVRISTSWSCRYILVHNGIFILRMNAYVLYICNLFEALQILFLLLHLKQEHEERERFLHHLRTHKYSGVNGVIFRLYKIHYVAFSQYTVLIVNILLHFVISVINMEGSVILDTSWKSILTYFIFLPQIQTHLLALLIHLPHVPFTNVCRRLLTFLIYYSQILI